MAGRERLGVYKNRGRLNIEERRQIAKNQRQTQRDKRRTEAFAERRGLTVDSPIQVPKNRLQKLLEWKKNNTKTATMCSKPAFIVSKMKYNDSHLYKPSESTTFNAPKGIVPVAPVPVKTAKSQKRVLRSQSKQTGQSKIKTALADFASAFKPVSKNDPKMSKKDADSDILNRTFDATPIKEPVESANKYVPIIRGENMKSPVTRSVTMLEVTDRIERSVRKSRSISRTETERSKREGKQSGTIVVNTHEPEREESDKNASFFRSLYDEAVTKLNNLCVEWNSLKCEEMTDTVRDQVDVAIGYAQLLISQKLQQFVNLISEHENNSNETELKVLVTDLEGFWGLVNNQVQDIYKKFDELSFLRENNWQPPTDNAVFPKRNKVAAKTVTTKGKTTSGLRSFLANARKRAKVGNENCDEISILDRVNELDIVKVKPMSPIVMKVSLRAKQISSPQVENSPLTPMRSPLMPVNRNQISFMTPTSKAGKAPRQKKKITPGNTPVRRSTRLAKTPSEDNF